MFNEMVRRLHAHERRLVERGRDTEHMKVAQDVGHRLSGHLEELRGLLERLSHSLPGDAASGEELKRVHGEVNGIEAELHKIKIESELRAKAPDRTRSGGSAEDRRAPQDRSLPVCKW